MPPPRWRQTKRHRDNPVGLGRNCAIFESARKWAYREARQIRLRHEYATAQDSHDLHTAIAAGVAERNAGFADPLPASEARAIANSIHRWITTRFYGWTDTRTVNEATFTAIQSARSRKAAEKRRTRKAEQIAMLRAGV